MSIFRDCDTCGHDFRDADDSPCASADDVETGCTGWVPSGAMEVALWKRKAREMAKDARWWRRRRERQLSHIDRAKEEVALQRHRGLRHWAKWVKRGEEIAELRAELEARAEVITGLQAALVEMRETNAQLRAVIAFAALVKMGDAKLAPPVPDSWVEYVASQPIIVELENSDQLYIEAFDAAGWKLPEPTP